MISLEIGDINLNFE